FLSYLSSVFVLLLIIPLFFFSSRRRHTRSKRDWSSDVCSSDLVIKALDSIPFDMVENHSIKIHTDSACLCNCFKDKWWAKWIMNDWKNSIEKDVANKEYWECIIDFYNSYDIEFIKVRGQRDNQMNNLADKLVNEAMDELEEESNINEKRS